MLDPPLNLLTLIVSSMVLAWKFPGIDSIAALVSSELGCKCRYASTDCLRERLGRCMWQGDEGQEMVWMRPAYITLVELCSMPALFCIR